MKICIIGAGTSGWWTAGYLEKKLNAEVTLYESENIPIIGVGESTLPQVKYFFEDLEIDESEWFDECNAVHKYGNKKYYWDDEPQPFTFSFWQDNNEFDELKRTKSRKEIHDYIQKTDGWNDVGYHFDATKAGEIVKNNCKNVKHIIDDLTELPSGFDLYVDCTGFKRKFINDKKLTLQNHHKTNRCWVVQTKLRHEDKSNYTISYARKFGWQFFINLQNRTGTGYVFSNEYVNEIDALYEFKRYLQHRELISEPRLLEWEVGVLEKPWQDNVVAIGNSAGFIDPLEATSLYMTVYSIMNLSNCILQNRKTEVYNKSMLKVWKECSDFIKCHYMLTKKKDTDFWKYYFDQRDDYKKIIWDNYLSKGNKFTNLFPSSMWAQLGLYYNEFEYYRPRQT